MFRVNSVSRTLFSQNRVVPPTLKKVIVSEYHGHTHFATDKLYAQLKERFFWPNMYEYIRRFVAVCETCHQTKCDTSPPKAPQIPMFIPDAPMQFVSMDIAYLPRDNNGYQYMLLVGDVFSKLVDAIPLKDQTAATIVSAFLNRWVFVHGKPFYVLTDQGFEYRR